MELGRGEDGKVLEMSQTGRGGRERDVAGVPLLGVSHRIRMEGEVEGDGREIRLGFRIFGRNRVMCVLVGMCVMCVQDLCVLLTA